MGDLTKNFSRFEFACRCGCGLDNIYMPTVEALQKLRELIGEPTYVTCGCRCERHNKEVGGVPDSQHLLKNDCKAADISTKHYTPAELADFIEENIEEFANGGIGRYAGFVHVDLGPKRRW